MNPLEEAFNSFRSEAFRFEQLPAYSIAEEKPIFGEYLQGALFPPVERVAWKTYLGEWHAYTRKCKLAEKRIIRVRMLNSETSAYLNMELEWAYPHSVLAGEEIFVISEESCHQLFDEIPGDFWLFDNAHGIDMQYSKDGAFIEGLPGKEPLEYYLIVRGKLLKNSVELSRYFSDQRRSRRF